jgi:hypothetical protein
MFPKCPVDGLRPVGKGYGTEEADKQTENQNVEVLTSGFESVFFFIEK